MSTNIDSYVNKIHKMQKKMLKELCKEYFIEEEYDYIIEKYIFNTKKLEQIFKHEPKNDSQSNENKSKSKTKQKIKLKITEPPKKIKLKIEKKDNLEHNEDDSENIQECDITNEFEYFANVCKRNKLKYYKYNASIFWTGPALILSKKNYSNSEIQKIKKKFIIKLKYDVLNNSNIVIYPEKKLDTNCITYDYIYEPKEENIIVEEWSLNNQLFLVNLSNNNIYNIETNDFIGKRKYDEHNTWYIDFNEKE